MASPEKETGMIYFINPLKVCIDFEEETYWTDRKCPKDAVAIDLITIDPGNAVTIHSEVTISYKPKNVLHLNGWDGVTFITVLHKIGRLNDQSFYLGNATDGLNNLCRCAFFDELSAPGETTAWRNRQLESQPEKWAALNAAANKEFKK